MSAAWTDGNAGCVPFAAAAHRRFTSRKARRAARRSARKQHQN